MTTAAAKLLVVEDGPPAHGPLTLALRSRGYDADSAPGAEGAITLLGARRRDVLVIDAFLGWGGPLDGMALVRRLRDCAAHRTLPVVLLTAAGDEDVAEMTRELLGTLRPAAIVRKPFSTDLLDAAIRTLLLGARLGAEGAGR